MAGPTLSGNEFDEAWNGSSHTTAGISWGTSVADLIVVAYISLTSNNNVVPTVTSVADSLGLTWTKQGSVSQNGITSGISSGPIAQTLEIWTAPAPGSPTWTGHTITVNASANTDVGIIIGDRLKFALLTAPIDLNISLPASIAQNTSGTLTLSGVSTDTANVCICAIRGAAGAGNNINTGTFLIAGSGDFGAGTLQNNTNFNIAGSQGRAFTSAQSGISITSSSSNGDSLMLAIAITADAQATAKPVNVTNIVATQ